MSEHRVRVKVRRQDGPSDIKTRRWEVFEVPRWSRMTVLDALIGIREDPRTVDGRGVSPVVWDCSCGEGRCGACAVLINGRAGLSCEVLVDEVSPKGQVVVVEPLTKFAVVRDLVVDRSKVFGDLLRLMGWVGVDVCRDTGEGLVEGDEDQAVRSELSQCVMCGCCLEVCPNVNDSSEYVGAAVINRVRYLGLYPGIDGLSGERLDGLMGRGGVVDCGKAQVCADVCPKGVPLVESIGQMSRATTRRMMGWLMG
ncbi:MAG: succinate dehydrogenase iron-sulfur subunit [Polyangiaceae bacterium]|nr:succinate dehydrogenase iron-sulfur subunit [Polyangiaceae bacterium]